MRQWSFLKKLFWVVFIFKCFINPAKAESLIVYAAASTINIIQEVSKLYQKQNPVQIHTSFASSGTLARQIAQGAPAHIFLSANPQWMDYVEQKNLLVPKSRFDLLSNRLVVITPKNQTFAIQWEIEFDLAKAFQGRFSIGNPSYVPAGIYAKEALAYFNWWLPLQSRMVATQNVRSALTFVERGEVGMGIVYETDALISKYVRVIGRFPEESHSSIVYPIALIATNETLLAHQFMSFLQTQEAQKIYMRYKFSIIQ